MTLKGTPNHHYRDPDDTIRHKVTVSYNEKEWKKIIGKAKGVRVPTWLKKDSLRD